MHLPSPLLDPHWLGVFVHSQTPRWLGRLVYFPNLSEGLLPGSSPHLYTIYGGFGVSHQSLGVPGPKISVCFTERLGGRDLTRFQLQKHERIDFSYPRLQRIHNLFGA